MGSLGDDYSRKKAMWLFPKVLGFHPSERWGHSACYSHGLVYIFGGCCGGMHFGDVLMLNLETMSLTTLATTGQGPGPRDSHSAVLVGRQMFVFGGTNGSKKVNDLHVLDLITKEWIRPECNGIPPCPRESHTATLIADDRIMIFGGSGEGEANYLNDLHVLDLKTMTWSSPEVKGDVPVPRDSHSAVAIGNKLFVYGGDRGDRYHGDVDVLDTNTMIWTKFVVRGCSPGVRAGHAAVNIGNKVCVIGGVGDKHYYNDVWILDVANCSWFQLDICGQQPQGRFSHTAVFTYSDIAIYGGCGEDERPLNEVLILQLGADRPDNDSSISTCKIFGQHWNHERRSLQRGDNNLLRTIVSGNDEIVRKEAFEPELESKQAFRFSSDTPYPKRKRNNSSKCFEVDSEQEEHSLSLSQHSSPSQSDQEQTPARRKLPNSITTTQGFNIFKPLNQIPRNCLPTDAAAAAASVGNIGQRTPYNLQTQRDLHRKPEQCLHSRPVNHVLAMEEKHKDTLPIQNLIGADVRGRVDGAFDSGLLLTATVNGKLFRGVLFAPAPEFVPRGAIATPANQMINVQQYPHRNHVEPCRQPSTMSVAESGHAYRQMKMMSSRTYPFVRGGPASVKEAKKLRNDLQGVVLTLGGPGSSHV
ncbi:protein GLUTELIN PRECURSOR ACCUMULATION 3-like [Euphorbia lathyris]|uniref:protein GLUTELIN PRECURSOR ACCUMULATION 3-like n=1 Tax=Euphorbia lathyris TaxID=212925 RepID=UPI00331408CD